MRIPYSKQTITKQDIELATTIILGKDISDEITPVVQKPKYFIDARGKKQQIITEDDEFILAKQEAKKIGDKRAQEYWDKIIKKQVQLQGDVEGDVEGDIEGDDEGDDEGTPSSDGDGYLVDNYRLIKFRKRQSIHHYFYYGLPSNFF